jgi:hypothetical protein
MRRSPRPQEQPITTSRRNTAHVLEEWARGFLDAVREAYRMKGKVAPFDDQNPSKRRERATHQVPQSRLVRRT